MEDTNRAQEPGQQQPPTFIATEASNATSGAALQSSLEHSMSPEGQQTPLSLVNQLSNIPHHDALLLDQVAVSSGQASTNAAAASNSFHHPSPSSTGILSNGSTIATTMGMPAPSIDDSLLHSNLGQGLGLPPGTPGGSSSDIVKGLSDSTQTGGTLSPLGSVGVLDHTASAFALPGATTESTGVNADPTAAIAASMGTNHSRVVDSTWQDIMASMVAELGYIESSRMMAVEELVLSKAYLKRAPQIFAKYIPRLLPLASEAHDLTFHESMKRMAGDEDVDMADVTGIDQDTTAKRRKFADDSDGINTVLNHASRADITALVDEFIAAKREQINESNRSEFINKSAAKGNSGDTNEGGDDDDDGCARVDARKLNRTIQMRQELVKNEALAKTNPKGHTADNNASQLGSSALDERLNNIQEHLNVRLAVNPPCTLMERVKILEDVIMQLERDYPPWAALHFNQPNRTFPPPPAVTTVTRGYMNQLVMTGDHLLSPSTMTGDVVVPMGVDMHPTPVHMTRAPSTGLDVRGMTSATSGAMTPGSNVSVGTPSGHSGSGGGVAASSGSSTGSATVIKLKRHGGGSSSLQRAVQEQLAQRQAMAAMGLAAPKPFVHPLNDPTARPSTTTTKGGASSHSASSASNSNNSLSPMMPPFEDLSKPGVTGRGPIKSRRKSIAKGLDPASAMAAMGVVGSPVLSAVNSGLSGVTSTSLPEAASKASGGAGAGAGTGDAPPKKPRKKRTSVSGPGNAAGGPSDQNGPAKLLGITKPPRTGLGKGKMGGASGAGAATAGRGLGKGKMGGGLGKGKGGAYLHKHYNQVSEDEEEEEEEEEEDFVKPATSRSSGKAAGRSSSSKAKKAKGRSAVPVRKFGGKSFGMVGGESSGSSSNESSDEDGDGSGSSGSQSDSSSSSSLGSGSDLGDSD